MIRGHLFMLIFNLMWFVINSNMFILKAFIETLKIAFVLKYLLILQNLYATNT